MTNEEYLKLKKRIEFVYSRKFSYLKFDPEDVSSEIITRWIGKKTGQTVDQAIIDFIRKYHGDSRLPGFARKTSITSPRQIDDARDCQYELDDGLNFEDYSKGLRGEERAIMVLLHKWGFNEKEIADCFGITKKWARLWIKKIQSGISEEIKGKKDGYANTERQREVEDLLPKATENLLW